MCFNYGMSLSSQSEINWQTNNNDHNVKFDSQQTDTSPIHGFSLERDKEMF